MMLRIHSAPHRSVIVLIIISVLLAGWFTHPFAASSRFLIPVQVTTIAANSGDTHSHHSHQKSEEHAHPMAILSNDGAGSAVLARKGQRFIRHHPGHGIGPAPGLRPPIIVS